MDPVAAYANLDGYKLIKNFYKDRTAERSGVPLINHIDEGVRILHHLGARINAIEAFMIHPLLQNDVDLAVNFNCRNICSLNGQVILFAMEYRKVANSYLPPDVSSGGNLPKNIPLYDTKRMLIADKVQNRKDFLKYQTPETCPNYDDLMIYFRNWINFLKIEDQYEELVKVAENIKSL